ncbi:MAG: EI24 domain-containing protein [Polyangiales bacterium]
MLYPLRGLAIMRRHGGLRRYWVPPIVLTGLALVASAVLSVRFSDDVVALIWQMPEGDAVWTRVLAWLHGALQFVALVLGFALGLVLCIGLASVFAAPFNDALSEAVELRETGQPPLTFSMARLGRDLVRTLRLELLKLLLYVAVLGPLLVISWAVPGPGQLAYTLFASLFTVVYLALDYLDWPASRRGFRVRQRIALLKVRPMMTLGFGVAVAACLFVPLLNLFFMPMAVAGGTRLFLDLMSYGERSMNGDVRPPSER